LIAVDTSVAIAGLVTWHASHEVAREVLLDRPALPAQCALETYSVLTRLPPPNRLQPAAVSSLLSARFADEYLGVDPPDVTALIRDLATEGIGGGAAYDGIVAMTAARADAVLVTLDRRAAATYRHVGVRFRLLGAAAATPMA
jgi:predicted nucleic acid-binding protein